VSGSTTSYDAFVLARGPSLLRFAYSLTGDRGRAEDLVQDALVKAYRRWDGDVALDRPEAYVRRIIVNTFLSWHRRRSNREIPRTVPDRAVDDTTDAFVQRDLVWHLLARLPRRQRAVLVLRYYEGLPDVEIAALLGCAEGTVRSLATRAFQVLRQHPELSGGPDPAEPLTQETR
jgi:RNA polymerase sigma-70 factor (sigma-E family)